MKRICLFLALSSCWLVACKPRPAPAPEAAAPRAFAWTQGEPEFLDPNRCGESAGTRIALNLFEGLVRYDQGNGPPRPGVAERWENSADGLVWTFHLRKDARWSNDRPVVAEDFVYSYRRVLDPKTASRTAQQLWFLRGARAFNAGKSGDPASVGVEAKDAHTLTLTLDSPAPFFLDLLCYISYVPVPKESIEAHGDQWTRPENIVTNGAFLLSEHAPRDRITLSKNPRYWDAPNVQLERAEVIHSDNESLSFDLYEAGKVQWTAGMVPPEKIDALKSRPDFHTDPSLCVGYYLFRTDQPPLDNPKVRQAISMSIDRQSIVSHILKGGQIPATHLVPEMFAERTGYKALSGPGFSPEQAKTLLSEAGSPGGVGFPSLELLFNTQNVAQLVAEAMRVDLKTHLGLSTTVSNIEWKSLLSRLKSGQFQMARSSWCADYPDPMTFLSVFHSESENNFMRWSSADYDAKIDAANKEPDRTKRNALMAEAEQILVEQAPVLPYYFYTKSYLLKPEVGGFSPQIQDYHLLQYIRWK